MQYLKILNIAGSIAGIASLIIMILTVNHVNIDITRIMDIVKIMCSILVILGILNNPTTTRINLLGKQ